MRIRKNGKVINLTESDLNRITERVLTEQAPNFDFIGLKHRIDKILEDAGIDPSDPEQFKENEDGSYTVTDITKKYKPHSFTVKFNY